MLRRSADEYGCELRYHNRQTTRPHLWGKEEAPMMTSALLTLLLMQAPYNNPQMPKGYEMMPAFRPHIPEEAMAKPPGDQDARKQETARQRQFAFSFNRLLETLRTFADDYNTSHTVDVKKVRAIKKAWRELEASDPWFKLDKRK